MAFGHVSTVWVVICILLKSHSFGNIKLQEHTVWGTQNFGNIRVAGTESSGRVWGTELQEHKALGTESLENIGIPDE